MFVYIYDGKVENKRIIVASVVIAWEDAMRSDWVLEEWMRWKSKAKNHEWNSPFAMLKKRKGKISMVMTSCRD